MRNFVKIIVVLTLLALSVACSSIPVGQRAVLREETVKSGEATKALFVSEIPGLEQQLAAAAGYFTGSISGSKVPVVGGARGIGVLVDNANDSRTFMNATRVDLGVGLGAGTDRILVMLETREAFEHFRVGIRKFGVGAEAGMGESAGIAHSFSGDGYKFLIAAESGAALTATARVLSFSVNIELTDVGVSDVSVPGTGFTAVDEQGEDAPRVWNRALPFLAQKVIDTGYNLPLPYGAGLIYAYNEQEQLLASLEVGINGRDKALFPFVSFDKAITKTDSPSAKLDAWLFPFMNVYANFGSFDADASIDILIDGNGMLEHLGLSCTGLLRPRLCDTLQDRNFLLPIDTTPSGTTWGFGAVLAGGWHNWFVTVPFNFSRIDLDKSVVHGGPIVTVAPRFGRTLSLGSWGNLALFAGGNYLKSELEISGTYRVAVEAEELIFDYTVQQRNKDEWNLLLGFNWDISKRSSWTLEYGGFIGTREAFIASASWRF